MGWLRRKKPDDLGAPLRAGDTSGHPDQPQQGGVSFTGGSGTTIRVTQTGSQAPIVVDLSGAGGARRSPEELQARLQHAQEVMGQLQASGGAPGIVGGTDMNALIQQGLQQAQQALGTGQRSGMGALLGETPGGGVAGALDLGAILGQAQAGGGAAVQLDAIRAHDPMFDENAFLSQAERCFFVVQEAWIEGRPELSRPVMADGLWQEQRLQMEQLSAQGHRVVQENLAVNHARISAAQSTASYDTITVGFDACSAGYEIDRKGKLVRGSRQVRDWHESWVFQRVSSATTRADGGTLAQRCPNCGAALDLDLAGVCNFCHTSVMSGALDWVLTRIDHG